MDIIVAGAHGQVAMHLNAILTNHRHRVRGMIRNPAQSEDLRMAGVEPVVFDLEEDDDAAAVIEGADAVIFCAGAGPGSGADRKWTVDRDGAIKLMDAARTKQVERYVMLSAMGVEEPQVSDNEVYQAYREAKAQADQALRVSGLAYTIIRPGALTDDEPTGRIAMAKSLDSGSIPRADVAAVLAYAVEYPETVGLEVEVTSGEQLVEDAFRNALEGGGRSTGQRP